jgi:hypothetical protein
MDITTGQMKQTRIAKMAKGVVASARVIDNKFRAAYGEPALALTHNGALRKHAKTGQPYYTRSSPYRCALITLTYAEDGQWDKRHLIDLIKHYREWFKRNGRGEKFHYVWVMELTEIGRPHYHLVAWFPKGVVPPLPDKQGWWPHGMTQAKFATSPVGYIAKYASKSETKSGAHLPKGARLWGYGGLRMDERGPVAFAIAPRWLKGLVHHESHVVKKTYQRVVNRITYACGFVHEEIIRKAGWFVKAGYGLGTWFFSPYEFEAFSEGGIVLSHRGQVEMLTSDGDVFHISHKG